MLLNGGSYKSKIVHRMLLLFHGVATHNSAFLVSGIFSNNDLTCGLDR
jgi:hypothetical protein